MKRLKEGMMRLGKEELHNVGHARYLVERATDENSEVCFDYTLVRSILNVIDRQSNEIHELTRTRSEVEAQARVIGYQEGQRDLRQSIRGLLGIELPASYLLNEPEYIPPHPATGRQGSERE